MRPADSAVRDGGVRAEHGRGARGPWPWRGESVQTHTSQSEGARAREAPVVAAREAPAVAARDP